MTIQLAITPAPAIDADLAAAFALTVFEVHGDRPITLRVQDGPDAVAATATWLDTQGARSAVVITAWNPFGQARPADENDAANRALLAEVEAAGLAWRSARGVSTTDDWFEDSYCVFDVPGVQIDAWLRSYGQHAVLRVHQGVPPVLVWHPDHRRG